MILIFDRGKDDAKIDKREASKQRRWNTKFCGKEILPCTTRRRYAHVHEKEERTKFPSTKLLPNLFDFCIQFYISNN